MKQKDYQKKMKDLKSRKREAMEADFKSAKERKSVISSFKKEARALKRSEKQAIARAIRDLGLF